MRYYIWYFGDQVVEGSNGDFGEDYFCILLLIKYYII